jgi:hypothetical protein
MRPRQPRRGGLSQLDDLPIERVDAGIDLRHRQPIVVEDDLFRNFVVRKPREPRSRRYHLRMAIRE